MFDYARSDTHFLLFIYDHLRNELLDQSDFSSNEGDLITQVLEKSKKEALQRYERSFYDEERGQGPGGWYNMLSRTPALFNKEQFAVFRAVHQWRDRTARTEDEGSAQVMPKHVLYNIAQNIPMDMASLLGCSHPISATLRIRIGELLEVIKKAKLAGAQGPEMKDLIEPFSTDLQVEKKVTSVVQSDSIPASASTLSHILRGASTMRSSISQFWGPILDGASSLRKETEAQMQVKGLRLALPLPKLTAEVFEPKVGAGSSRPEVEAADPGALAEHQYTTARKPKDRNVFVVKQLGGSRKRKAADMQDVSQPELAPATAEAAADEGSHDDQDDANPSSVVADKENQISGDDIEASAPEVSTKTSKSQRKRARKRAETQRMNETVKAGDASEAKPFDYAAAPSVLHPKRHQVDRPGAKQPFDPYAKSMNAPKGMRKSKKDSGGRSSTFKN